MAVKGNFMAMAAYIAHTKGEYDKAMQLYEEAVKSGMNNIKYIHSYGVLLMQRGYFEKAIDMFGEALKLMPDQTSRYNIRLDRAIAYIRCNDMKKAQAALEDLHNAKRSLRVYQTLGYYYILTGNDEMAVKYNNEALDYSPEDPIILDNMCQYCINHDNFEDAEYFAKKAYENRQDQVNILYHLAIISEHYGRISEALKYIEEAKTAKINATNDLSVEKLNEAEQRIKSKL